MPLTKEQKEEIRKYLFKLLGFGNLNIFTATSLPINDEILNKLFDKSMELTEQMCEKNYKEKFENIQRVLNELTKSMEKEIKYLKEMGK